MEKNRETQWELQQKLESIKKNLLELNNTITKMKYILEGVNSILSDKEECINHQTKKENEKNIERKFKKILEYHQTH